MSFFAVTNVTAQTRNQSEVTALTGLPVSSPNIYASTQERDIPLFLSPILSVHDDNFIVDRQLSLPLFHLDLSRIRGVETNPDKSTKFNMDKSQALKIYNNTTLQKRTFDELSFQFPSKNKRNKADGFSLVWIP